MTYLAVPVAPKSLQEAEEQLKAAVAVGAEMVELRTDYLVHLSIELALQVIGAARALAPALPVIVTCRDYHQGGALRHSNQLRTDVLTAAVRAGADYIDVEYDNFLSEAIRSKLGVEISMGTTKLILSAHNFQTKFKNITKLYWEIANKFNGCIPKLVYSAHHINDCFDILDLLHDRKGDVIAFCMDEPGFITRVIAKKLGAFVSFASIDEKTATAPGQTTVAQLKNILRWDSLNAQTELYGVIGSPIGHSLSPAIHNACFAEQGMNKAYLPLLVSGRHDDFNAFMDNILSRPWLDFRGFSVTIPHKENALNYVKQKNGFIDPLAAKIGAINTLIKEDFVCESENRKLKIENRKSIMAYNTDCPGALDTITTGLGIDRAGLKKMPVAVIGAGGVARAIVAGLTDAKAKVIIYNRTIERAKQLAHEFKCDYAGLDGLRKLKAKLIINCTSIGMSPNSNATPVDAKFLNKDMAVFDTIYNPAETILLKQARTLGCKTISGVDMFISQAAGQFKLFTGKDLNRDLVRQKIYNCLLPQ